MRVAQAFVELRVQLSAIFQFLVPSVLQYSISPVNSAIKTKSNLVLNNDGLEFRIDYNCRIAIIQRIWQVW